jgi:arsenate reductase
MGLSLLQLPVTNFPANPEKTMNVTIYHNPGCSKSRKTLEIIESKGLKPRIVEYLANPPAPDTLVRLAQMLEVPLGALLRTGEADFAESPEAVPLHDEQALSQWLHDHPRVLQRPIVVDDDQKRAVIGRPPENVLQLISAVSRE